MATVWVASKMPNGLVIGETVLNKALRTNPLDKLKPDYKPLPYPMLAGYALTEVPEEQWERWFKANRDSDLIKNKIVFGHAQRPVVEGFCVQNRGVKTGLEP